MSMRRDEWFACSPTKTELVFLHELIDSRYGRHATIVCSQMPSENWAQYCPNKALGESISGRILAHCYCIRLEGEDMRKTSGLREKICARRTSNDRDPAV